MRPYLLISSMFVLCSALILGTGQVHAQQCLKGSDNPLTLSDQAVISMITVYPGNQIHAYWGHSALRISDPYYGFDIMYNYGAFVFDDAFLPKFVYGKLDYILCDSRMQREIERYKNWEKRTLVEQVLALNKEERQAVFEFVNRNALPQNRTYRYDFLFDNCSTRIRDVIEDVLGRTLTYRMEDPDESFRQILGEYVEHEPFLNLGIDLGLALPVDKVPTARELMGLPMPFMEAYDTAVITRDGEEVPLVSRKDTLLWVGPASVEAEAEGAATVLYVLVWGIFALGLVVTNARGAWMARIRIWFDRVFYSLLGLIGLLGVFLWFIALHEVTNVNWNLIWAWPTHILIVPLLHRKKNRVRTYMRVCSVVVFVALLGWYYWPQEMNIALIPILLTSLVRSSWWGWNAESSEEPSVVAAEV